MGGTGVTITGPTGGSPELEQILPATWVMAEYDHVEQPAHEPLVPINLEREADAVDQPYKNFVLNAVNDHCVRMAIMTGEYRWHYHPRSDETFVVLEGRLEVDLEGKPTVQLQPGTLFTIPAGVRHRTRAVGRTVNLCFENAGAYTDVVFTDTVP